MKLWANTSIVVKTIISFSVILVLTAVLGSVALMQMRALNSMSSELHNVWIPNVRDTGIMETTSTRFRGLEFLHILADTDKEKKEIEKEMMENFQTYAKAKERVRDRIGKSEAVDAIYNKIEETEEEYVRKAHIKALELSYKGLKKEGVDLLMVEALPIKKRTDQAMGELVDYCNKMSNDNIVKSGELYIHSKRMIILNIVFAFIIGISFIVVISRSLKHNLGNLISGVNKIAEGDLSYEIKKTSEDEMGVLADAINSMSASLRNIVMLISQTSNELSDFSKSMTESTGKILESFDTVDQQSTSVAGASEELAVSSEQVSGNCTTSAEEAATASDYTREGFYTVESTISIITETSEKVQESKDMVIKLGERSDDIGAIIDTIKDIAEQTNLLALNAAIEAARAGDHGRGFAVVADEVRTLAERTATATGDISAMIQSIQKVIGETVTHMGESTSKLDSGVESVHLSGEKLKLILDKVDSVNTQINQIAEAALQQSHVTKDISRSMTEVSAVVKDRKEELNDMQRNIGALSEKTDSLDEIVKTFRL
jgi:methyl-accepting chemotaxis protein